ncbi:MAG TPA: hypothetical protein PK868_06115 [Phycicoccus sp.]|jgi:hypothetical protein|nr:hypothetical protein [Phycicoccus sp.]HQH08007.1 hypothetical protein [Phycicoccus sp.]HQK31399.1 hypothetical protein [Phycicoccus sp.]
MTQRLSRLWVRLRTAGERGDVPGWVLITLMTAMIVTVLITVARDRLIALFEQAMDQFT